MWIVHGQQGHNTATHFTVYEWADIHSDELPKTFKEASQLVTDHDLYLLFILWLVDWRAHSVGLYFMQSIKVKILN